MKKIIAFYGTIVLKLDDLLQKELNCIWEEGERNSTQEFYKPYYEKVLSLQSMMFEILKQKSNVKNVRWYENLSLEHSEPFMDYVDLEEYLMRFSSPIMFDVNLPLNERKYIMELEEKNYIEEYSVIYNGTVFLAYAQVDDEFSDSIDLGPEIRESLEKTLYSAIWTPKIMPPCPIRMKFFVQSSEDANLENAIDKDLGLIYDKATYEDINDVEEIMLDLFFRNNYDIEDFCSVMSLKHKAERLTWEIRDVFEEIQEKFKLIQQDKYCKKTNNDLRRNIFELYQKLYEYDQILFQYHSHEERIIKSSDDLTSSYLKEYILSELPIREYNQGNVLNSVSYIEDRLSENRAVSSSISAALIGGLSGSIASIIILLIEKLF